MNKFFLKNNEGAQKTIMITLLGVAIILVVLVAVDMFKKPIVDNPIVNVDNNAASMEVVDNLESDLAPAAPVVAPADEFRAEVPVNTIVPGVDTQLTEDQKKEIALPVVVVPAAPGSTSKFRNFKISAENDVFIPNKVIANVGDTVHVDFTAVDKAYDIAFPSYNMKQSAIQGQTRILEFKARKEGSFIYYCPSCGGPETGPTGSIIIVAIE